MPQPKYIPLEEHVAKNVSIENKPLSISGGKLAGMLLITWLTFGLFVGLGNLIFLWNDMHHRRRAAVALGLTLGTGLISIILSVSIIGAPLVLIAIWIPLGMAIWMTIDACIAYSKYKVTKY